MGRGDRIKPLSCFVGAKEASATVACESRARSGGKRIADALTNLNAPGLNLLLCYNTYKAEGAVVETRKLAAMLAADVVSAIRSYFR
jgi:hypothetical protein